MCGVESHTGDRSASLGTWPASQGFSGLGGGVLHPPRPHQAPARPLPPAASFSSEMPGLPGVERCPVATSQTPRPFSAGYRLTEGTRSKKQKNVFPEIKCTCTGCRTHQNWFDPMFSPASLETTNAQGNIKRQILSVLKGPARPLTLDKAVSCSCVP